MDSILKQSLVAAAREYKEYLKQSPRSYEYAVRSAQREALACFRGESRKSDPNYLDTKDSVILNNWTDAGWWYPKGADQRHIRLFFETLEERLDEGRGWDFPVPTNTPSKTRQAVKNSKPHRFERVLKEVCEFNPDVVDIYSKAKSGELKWPDAYYSVSGHLRYGSLCTRCSSKPEVMLNLIIEGVNKAEPLRNKEEVFRRTVETWKSLPPAGRDSPHSNSQIPQCYLCSGDIVDRLRKFYTVKDQNQIINGLEEYLKGNTKPKTKRSKVSQTTEKPLSQEASANDETQGMHLQERILEVLRKCEEMKQIQIKNVLGVAKTTLNKCLKKMLKNLILSRNESTQAYRIQNDPQQIGSDNPQMLKKPTKERKKPIPEPVGVFVFPPSEPVEEGLNSGNGYRTLDVKTEHYTQFLQVAEKKRLTPDELFDKMLRDAQRPHVKGQRRS